MAGDTVKWFAQVVAAELKHGDVVVVEINLNNGYTYIKEVSMAEVSSKHPFRTDIPMNDMLQVVGGLDRAQQA